MCIWNPACLSRCLLSSRCAETPREKKQNKNVPSFPALETIPVLPFVALAFGNNPFSSCLFFGCVTWLDSVMAAVGKKG